MYTIAADLTDAASAAAMVDRVEKEFGALDVLVNSAGAAKRTDADDLTPEAWRAGMDAKYFSYINVMDPVIKRMGKRGHGAVINVIGSGGKSLRRRTCRRRRQRGAAPSDRRARLRLCIERGQGRRRESRRDQTERVAQGLKAEEASERDRRAGLQADDRAPADGPSGRTR